MTTPSSGSHRLLKILAIVVCLFATLFLALGCGVYRSVTLRSGASALKVALLPESMGNVNTKVQVSVGPVLLGMAGLLVPHVNDVPPEAVDALRCVRSASVGVYELSGVQAGIDAAAVARADAVMSKSGWHRLVAVRDNSNTVLIYAPRISANADVVDVCIGVLDGRNCVVVSARLHADGLAHLVQRQLPRMMAAL
jgi:hypothetical protein